MNPINAQQQQVSFVVDDEPEIVSGYDSDDETRGSGRLRFDDFAAAGAFRVNEGGDDHMRILKRFMEVMDLLWTETQVVAVHRGPATRRPRNQSFKNILNATIQKRGRNTKGLFATAYYGASREEVCTILAHGFFQVGEDAAAGMYGAGVYLSKFSIDEALNAEPDDYGLRHVLMCLVILGKSELIEFGSKQFCPSSGEFDSGVDSFSTPRRYIVWTPYMNSHILPGDVISFKIQIPPLSGLLRCYGPFPVQHRTICLTLISVLSRFLPPSSMTQIYKDYNDLLDSKITAAQLLVRLDQIAGRDAIVTAVKEYRRISGTEFDEFYHSILPFFD